MQASTILILQGLSRFRNTLKPTGRPNRPVAGGKWASRTAHYASSKIWQVEMQIVRLMACILIAF